MANSILIGFFYYILICFTIFFSLRGKNHYALLGIVFLIPLQNIIERFHSLPLGKDLIDLSLFLIILFWSFRSFNKEERMFCKTDLNGLIFFLIIFTYINLWRGSFFLDLPLPLNPRDVRLQMWKNYMVMPIIYLLIVNNVKNLKQIKVTIFIMALAFMISNYYTFNQIRWMNSIISRIKIHGTFVWLGPNEVAAFYADYFFIFLAIGIFYKKNSVKIICGVIVVLSLINILFLYSRGAYIAVIGGLLFWSFARKKILIIPLLLLLFFWQNILPSRVIERINQTQNEQGELDHSSQRRIELWKASLNMFCANPLLGTGFAVISFVNLDGELKDTHNIYMKILVEQGAIGIIIFFILIFISLKMSWRLYKKTEDNFLKGLGFGFMTSVVVLLITNIFGDRWTYLQVAGYYWVLLGLVVRANILMEN